MPKQANLNKPFPESYWQQYSQYSDCTLNFNSYKKYSL